MKRVGLLGGIFLLTTLLAFALTPAQFISQYNGIAPKEYQLIQVTGKTNNYTISQNSNIQIYLVGQEIMMVILDSSKMTPDQLKTSIAEFNTMANYVIFATQKTTSLQLAQQIFKNLQSSKSGSVLVNNITYVLSADDRAYNLEVDF